MVKRIDFHIHTVSSNKDYDFTYSSDWIKRYVEEAELDAIAITNHDLFDLENFKKVKEDLPDITVFPGIELSLEEGHVNIIFSEEDIENLVNFSNWLSKNELEIRDTISTEDFCNNMVNWENGIYIFEMGKSNSLSVPEKLSNSSITIAGGVANQLKFQSIYNQENMLIPLLFSDAHAADDDPEPKRKNIHLLKMKNTFLQIDNCTFSEIKNCIKNKKAIHINEKNLRDVIEINNHMVSTGMNLIVGKRGTGKTEFLKNIKKQYDDDEYYEIAQFETARADEYIEKQRKEQGQFAFDIWKRKYESQFRTIIEYLNRDENEFDGVVEKYLESVKNFAKDNNLSNSKEKYLLHKESKFDKIPTANLEKYLTDLKSLIQSNEFWSLLKNPNEKKQVFIETYNELRILYIEKQQENKIKERVNEILESVKKLIQSRTGVTTVLDCEFSEIIQKQQMEKQINTFMKNIICEQELKRENVYGYQIIVKISPFENASQFQSVASTREAVNDEIIKPYLQSDYITFLNNLKKKKFYKTSDLANYFINLTVELLDSDGTPASGGQAVGFALMMRLEESKNKPIILIDEPEASLDNAYIRDELIPALNNLSRESTVFVVTHNSTLGALINPDYLIVTTKDQNNNYKVLTGEFSSNSISNNLGVSESSYNKFVEAMESGIETYRKKGETYENLRNK